MFGFNHGHKWNKDGITVFCDLCGCEKDSDEAREKCPKRHESHFETVREDDDDFIPATITVPISTDTDLPTSQSPIDNSDEFAGGESGGAGGGGDFADPIIGSADSADFGDPGSSSDSISDSGSSDSSSDSGFSSDSGS